MMRPFTINGVLLLLGALFVGSRAEHIYEEIQWSSELCSQMGHAGDFDVCGVLEFCEGDEDDFQYLRRRRSLRRRKHRGEDNDISKTDAVFQPKVVGNSPAEGKQEEPEQWDTDSGDGETFAEQVTEAEAEEEDMKEEEGVEIGEDMDEEEEKEILEKPEPKEEEEVEPAGETELEEPEPPNTPASSSRSGPDDSWEDMPSGMGKGMEDEDWELISHENDEIDDRPMSGGSMDMGMDMHGEDSNQGSSHHAVSHGASSGHNEARYGWRLPGSNTCSWPGPLMRLKRGLKHGLFIKGSGKDDSPTNLHLHGLHIAGHGNSDDASRTVKGHDVLIYNITLPADQHMGGTHWYHTHYHMKSFEHIGGGAFGPLIVDDNGHDIGTSDASVLSFLKKDRLLVLDNRSGDWRANGLKKADTYTFHKDEWYRLRMLTVSIDGHHSTHMVNFDKHCEVRAIAHDGIFRFQVPAEPKNTYALTVASRLDVAIRCSASSTIRIDFVEAVNIAVVDSADADLVSTPFEAGNQTWSSKRPAYLEDLRPLKVNNQWTAKIDTTNINGISCSENKPLCSNHGTDFKYGSVQEWTLRRVNTHSFHLHSYPMQIVSATGCGTGHDVGEFYDTVFAVNAKSSDRCLVRLRMVDVAGPVLMHCHNLKHADHGSMGYIMVDGGPKQPSEPRVQECTSGPVCDKPHARKSCGM